MDSKTFASYWQQHYGSTPLIAHELRTEFPHRWLRIHSLPESKRYAQTPAEYDEILRRQNSVIGDLIGAGQPCELVFSHFGEPHRLPDVARSTLEQLQPRFLRSIDPAESGLEAEYELLHASFAWRHSCLDPVLLAIADDVLETSLLVGTACQRVLAPYDGGMDLIFEDRAARDQHKKLYFDWLSKHPDGL